MVDPLNSSHILSGNDGGVSESWNGGKNWSQKNGIRAQQFYDVAVDQERPYNVMGGTQDNGAWIGRRRTATATGCSPPIGSTCHGRRLLRRARLVEPEYIYYESQFARRAART